MTTLSDRLAAAKGEHSIDDIVRLAEREGHKIHRSVVARYLNGEHGPRPSDSTIMALAAGFGLDVREVRVLAGMVPGELGPYEPTHEAARLNREQRAALDQLIRAIVRSESDDDKPAPKKSLERGAAVATAQPLGLDAVPAPDPQPASRRPDPTKSP